MQVSYSYHTSWHTTPSSSMRPLPFCSAVSIVIPNLWISLQTLRPELRNAARLAPALLRQAGSDNVQQLWSNRKMLISRAWWCYIEGWELQKTSSAESCWAEMAVRHLEQQFSNSCSNRLLQETWVNWAALWQLTLELSWLSVCSLQWRKQLETCMTFWLVVFFFPPSLLSKKLEWRCQPLYNKLAASTRACCSCLSCVLLSEVIDGYTSWKLQF